MDLLMDSEKPLREPTGNDHPASTQEPGSVFTAVHEPDDPTRGRKESHQGNRGVLVFGISIFASAFLLFQVQPVIARYILPWYGGSPAVWTTCLLFFQLGLLAGYAYAHALVSLLRTRPAAQVMVHGILILAAIFLLPITPSPDLKPDASGADPVWGILGLLLQTVAAPYFLLSATGPLFQHWFSQSHPGRSPFRLYAVSNLGSMLGLLTYPFLFERIFSVTQQTRLWSAAFTGYALLAVLSGWVFVRMVEARKPSPSNTADGSLNEPTTPPHPRQILTWILYSTCGSVLLLSLTSQMTQDIAVVPFLWVVPLALYLLTFVIAFDHPRWYRRGLAIPLAAVSIASTLLLMNWEHLSDEGSIAEKIGEWPLLLQVGVYCSSIFFTCLICHGEIAHRKPTPRHLTGFYLAISFGGAAGGMLVSLVAPRVFDGYWELHLALAVLALLTSASLYRPVIDWYRQHSTHDRGMRVTAASSLTLLWVASLGSMGYALVSHIKNDKSNAIETTRGFYGVLRVTAEDEGTEERSRIMYHGRINHGCQYLAPKYRRAVTTYYGVKGGVGTAFRCLPERAVKPATPIRVGVVGLGVGTIAAYAKPGDKFTFYEINPQVETLARSHFSYLEDCRGEVSVVLGDARITLEAELERGDQHELDMLVIDAFSGDAIPIHLITQEAFDLYTRRIKTDGVLAFHITNRHVDLSDLLRNMAADAGCEALLVMNDPDSSFDSDWVLISRDQTFINILKETGRLASWSRPSPKQVRWTDDYGNLFDVLY